MPSDLYSAASALMNAHTAAFDVMYPAAPEKGANAAFADTPATLIKVIRYPGRADSDQGVGAHRDAGVLTLSTTHTFGSTWLAPRLAQFRAANPDVRISLVPDAAVDFTEANLDLAVRWVEGPGELEGIQLGEAARVTVGEGPWIAWPGDALPGGRPGACISSKAKSSAGWR